MSASEQLTILKKTYPDAKYYLDFDTPFHLVIATILSAQCTDAVVNRTTPAVFAKYRKPDDLMKASEQEVAADIKSISFAGNKAKYLKKMAETLIKDFGGEVPKDIDQLTTLSGVGKKTANAIQQNAFSLVNGVIVDTHVIRVSQRLGWTKNKDPEKIEQDLMRLFPKADWKIIPHLLKAHGQQICTAKKALCEKCPLNKTCPSAFKV
jgi:endonuclease III